MQFEIKKIDIIGGVKTKDENTSSQTLIITVGVVGCPYPDLNTSKIVEYTFSNTISVQDFKNGINIFANSWLNINYPSISGTTA